jgi:hypothetical protein
MRKSGISSRPLLGAGSADLRRGRPPLLLCSEADGWHGETCFNGRSFDYPTTHCLMTVHLLALGGANPAKDETFS